MTISILTPKFASPHFLSLRHLDKILRLTTRRKKAAFGTLAAKKPNLQKTQMAKRKPTKSWIELGKTYYENEVAEKSILSCC